MFLKSGMSVVTTSACDYPEWHKGRSNFSLWYLEIINPALINYLDKLKANFSDLLYTPNNRQYHITLFICGFLSDNQRYYDDDFKLQQLDHHIYDLNMEKLTKFRLQTGKVNSFESALYVEVEDLQNDLNTIRSILGHSCEEVAPLDYVPHITLGLYKHDVKSDEIFRRISELKQRNFTIQVDYLTFGIYQAQLLQGPLYMHHQYDLGAQ